MSTRIACSPLSGRIHAGRVNKEGTAFIGQKQDVTSDVLRAVIEKAEFHGGTFEIEGGDRKWIVTVSAAVATGSERPQTAPGSPAEALGPDEQNQGGAQGKGET